MSRAGASGVLGRATPAVLAQRLVDVTHREAIALHRLSVAIVGLVDQSKDPGETTVGLALVAVLDTDRSTPAPRNGLSS